MLNLILPLSFNLAKFPKKNKPIILNYSSLIGEYNQNYAEGVPPEARWKIVYLGVWMNQLSKQIEVHTVMISP